MRSHSAAAACGALRCQAPYSDVCLPYHLAHTGSQLYPHLQMGKLRHGVATCPARYHIGGRGGRPGAAKALSGVEGGPTGPGGPRTEVGAQPHPTCAPTQSRGRPGRGCADQGVVWVRTPGAPVRTASSSQVGPPCRLLLGYTGEPSPEHKSLGAPQGRAPPRPPHRAPSSEQRGQDAWGQGWSCCPAPGVGYAGPRTQVLSTYPVLSTHTQYSMPSAQYLVPSGQYSYQCSVPGTQYPVLSTYCSISSAQCSAPRCSVPIPSTQYLVLNTQYPSAQCSVLNTRY